MGKFTKRTLAIVLCVILAISLGACASNQEAAPDTAGADAGTAAADNTPDTAAADSGEKVTIAYQTWNPDDMRFPPVKADFEEKYPNIEIAFTQVAYSDHIQKLKIDLASGQGPDVFSLQTGASLTEFRDFETDLTPLAVKEWGDGWRDNFIPFTTQLTEDNGVFYGLPMGTSYAGTIWADLTYFDKYSIEVPKNLNELKEVAKTFRDNKEYPLAIGAKDDWINLDMWMNIANDISSEKLYSAIDGKTPFTDEALVQSFALWQSLFTDGVFQDGALGVNMYSDTTDLFDREGSIPMICNGIWVVNNYPATGDEDMEKLFTSGERPHTIFTMDWNNDGKAAPVQATVENVLCMNNKTPNPDEAWTFISYMLYDGQDILNNEFLMYLPSRANTPMTIELNDEGKENLDKILDYGDNHVGGYREIAYPELKQVIADNLKSLALGEVAPDAAAAAIEAASQSQKR